MRSVFLVLKFGLLSALYFFILRVFYFIVSDIRRSSRKSNVPDRPDKAGVGAELVVTDSKVSDIRPGDIIRLAGETRIGRGRNNDLKINDSFVSHNHARIIFNHEDFFLEDLDSINGTYINGTRTREKLPLEHGDTIKIAGVTFKFVRWEYEVE